MRKQEEISNPDSCINKAEDDEPVFVLRAKDILALTTVHYWVETALMNGVHDDKIQKAQQWMNVAASWRAGRNLPAAI